MNIAIYDLDKTLTRRATFTRFLIYFARRTSSFRLMGLPIWMIALIAYRIGLYGRKPLKQFGIAMFMGRRICPDILSKISTDFANEVVHHGLQPGAVARMRRDQERKALLVLATAAPEFYAQKIGKNLGFHAIIATRHFTAPDGKITSQIDGKNCYADEKLRRIEGWLTDQGITRAVVHIRFYSDDISDSPALNFADQGYAINPSKAFANAAAESNWGTLNFRHEEEALDDR